MINPTQLAETWHMWCRIHHQPATLEEAEEMVLRRALELTHGNVSAVGRLLHLTYPRLQRLLKKHAIHPQ